MTSRLMRVPNDSAKEIEDIARQYKISLAAAFNIWKDRKLNIKWKQI